MENEPLNSKRTQDLYKLLYGLKSEGKIRKGMNEAIKAVNGSTALLVVIAKDSVPQCLVDPLPSLCEWKGVPYVFVESKAALGKACGVTIDVLACAIAVSKDEDSTKISTEISKIIK